MLRIFPRNRKTKSARKRINHKTENSKSRNYRFSYLLYPEMRFYQLSTLLCILLQTGHLPTLAGYFWNRSETFQIKAKGMWLKQISFLKNYNSSVAPTNWVDRLKFHEILFFAVKITNQILFQCAVKQQFLTVWKEEITPCPSPGRRDFSLIDSVTPAYLFYLLELQKDTYV